MKIGIDISVLTDPHTGIARVLINTMNCLQKIDHENEYYLFEKSPTGYEIYNKNWKKILLPTVLPGTLWVQFIIPTYCQRLSLDLFWAPEQISPLFNMKKVKIVTMIYDLVFIRYPETINWPRIWISQTLIPATLKASTRITTISETIKKELILHYPFLKDKIDVVYCGHPGWKIPSNYNFSQREEHLFFIGNFEPRKNLINIFKALEILREKGMIIKLKISGPAGWKNKKIKEYLKRSTIRDQIVFMGFISETQLKREYLYCKALLYPSLYEGFGLPVLEAISLDCPVITSKNTSMEEIAGDCVILCDPQKPESIANAIEKLYRGDVTSITKDKKEKLLSKFTWDNVAILLKESFDKALKD